MLTLQANNCKECGDIVSLLQDIDCKLFDMSKRLYNNLTLELNKKFTEEVYVDLLHYKRILERKAVNPDYVYQISVSQIGNKVNILKYKS